jgi:hypothetical protein
VRRIIRTPLLVAAFVACACDDYRGPHLALSTQPASTKPAERHPSGAPPAPKGPMVYCGKTADQWARALQGRDRDEITEACRALQVMGREGREHLFRGLDSTNPETRRICLETLTIADFKKLSEPGRQKLVKLSYDRDDMRIRERAAYLLRSWHGSIPSP